MTNHQKGCRLRKLNELVSSAMSVAAPSLKESIRADLLTRDYDDLIALPAPTTKTPTEGSIAKRRPKRKP